MFTALLDTPFVLGVLKEQDLRKEQELFTVQTVRDALGAHYLEHADALFGGFVDMITHEALIGVQDRHHENWGVISQRDVAGAAPRFAPLYDSARGLFCNIKDEHLVPYVKGERNYATLAKYVSKSHPLIGCAGVEPRRQEKCITHDQLLAAVYREWPQYRHRIRAILAAYDWRFVRNQLRLSLGSLCTPVRLHLILLTLRRRLRMLRSVLDGRGMAPSSHAL